MYKPIKVSIPGYNLSNGTNCSFSFTKNSNLLVKGYVTNSNKSYVKNAGVEIIKVNTCTNFKESLGVVFTDENGYYAISLPVLKKTSKYLFNAYSPL